MVLRGVAGQLPLMSPRRRTLLVAMLVVVVVLASMTTYATRARGADLSRCDGFAAGSAARAAQVSGWGERVVVIGDSYSAGLGLTSPSASWPSRLPGRVHVAAFSGSGFSEGASDCGRVSFADRAGAAVRGGASLVVVEGGLNDVDQSETAIRAGFARLVRALHGLPVVVVGPVTAPSRAAAVPRVDALLADLCEARGIPYVATSDLRLTYLDDRLHLTPAGHRAFGDDVAARIAALS